jgi:hypothetical protein
MIKITKGPKPKVLTDQAEDWTNSVRDALARGEKLSDSLKSKYNHRDVKDAILAETYKKCAYCESKPRHVEPGDIEHVVPKSASPELWFEWTNLTLACSNCNTKKGTREGFVDPNNDNPDEHLYFYGPLVFALDTSPKGQITETILKLNREDLRDKRIERIVYLEKCVKNIQKESDAATRAILKQDFLETETLDSCEYAAMSRAFVQFQIANGFL